ncbi:Uncharacterized protein dnm_077480 [Desulfonema magnum]|uniref:PEP-CTERM sorting domain-containing protein n=1 Tax=Desulfonema magnum TaxID=45655 RepID=A0A975BV33_9BACT|nr:Uncharacterized protein dnm_077480 [Desulfonema magnum]
MPFHDISRGIRSSAPAPILLLGSGLIGLAGLRKKLDKN